MNRFHGLDACRAAAMMLGLFFHGAISFMRMAGPWAIQDRSAHPAVDVFVWICHTFRMPVFFLLAGFFARLVYEKIGTAGFVRHRAKRLVLPFIVGLPPMFVLIYLLWRWGWSMSAPRPMEVLGMETPSLDLDKIRPSPGHLWFLYYLIMLQAVAVVVVVAERRVRLDGAKRAVDAVVRALVKTRLVAVVMAIPTAATLWFMKTPAADTPVFFAPEPRILAYYAVFMGFGWMLHRRTDLIEEFGRRLWVPAALALAAIVPLGRMMERVMVQGMPATPAERAGMVYLGALFGWSLVLLFLGTFVRWGSRPRPWVAYLSDASYWCYLVHLPLVVALQILVATLAWPGPVKYAMVMAVTIAVCLGTYRLFVRYTAIGATLNGPREKPAPALGGTAGLNP